MNGNRPKAAESFEEHAQDERTGIARDGKFPRRKLTSRAVWLCYAAVLTALAVTLQAAAPRQPNRRSAGTLLAWGFNGNGELGNGGNTGSSVPESVNNLTGVITVAAGLNHSLALTSDGQVWAWGSNASGQLGSGNTLPSNAPMPVGHLTGMIAVAAGFDHSLALTSDGKVWAWGGNFFGQLGNGSQNGSSNVPVAVGNLSGVVAIAAGNGHSLALTSDGKVWAWGSNFLGQLGNGQIGVNANSSVPVRVTGLSGVVAIAAGGTNSLAVTNDFGEVWAWGNNAEGQLGNGGNGAQSTVPAPVSSISGIVSIAGGDAYSLALDSGGRVWAWGENLRGQLGNGSNTFSLVPVNVSNLSGIVSIAAGDAHSLALDSGGRVWTWGDNSDGQLGKGGISAANRPLVTSLAGIVAVAAGGNHSLALHAEATGHAWGYNGDGRLGNDTTMDSNAPVPVSNLSGVVAMAGGEFHSLALTSIGEVWAWGGNSSGQLGNGSISGGNKSPARVSGLSGAMAIAAGREHSLALTSNGTVWAWGYNGDGELGNGGNEKSGAPVVVPNLADVVAISAGSNHSLALSTDFGLGQVKAWGSNAFGQLGNGMSGPNADSNVPVAVSVRTGVVAVAAGGLHSLALENDGTVWAWGVQLLGPAWQQHAPKE